MTDIAMPRPGTEITREQLDILRNKFDLLQGDRKAYFETYEATKKANEQLLKDLRDGNKDLRKRLSNLQKEGRDAAVTDGAAGAALGVSGAPGAPTSALGKLEAAFQTKRNAYDLLRARTKERQKELQTLRDQFRCGVSHFHTCTCVLASVRVPTACLADSPAVSTACEHYLFSCQAV